MKLRYQKKGTTWEWSMHDDSGKVLANGVDLTTSEEDCLDILENIKAQMAQNVDIELLEPTIPVGNGIHTA